MKKQRIRNKGKRDGSRKLYFLILALVIVIVGGLTGWILLTKGEVSFEEAMKKSEVRESYIAKIVEKIGQPNYVTVVNYDDTSEEMEFLRKEYKYIPPSG